MFAISAENLSAQTIADYLVQVLADENIEYEQAGIEILAKSAQGVCATR